MARFSPTSPGYQAFSAVADTVLINVAIIVCSLPVITLGPALRAGHRAITKTIRSEGSSTLSIFWATFTSHWKTSAMWGLVTTTLSAVGVFELWWVATAQAAGVISTSVAVVLRGIVFSGLVLLLALSAWLFFNESREPKPLLSALTSAAVDALAHPSASLAALALAAVPSITLTVAPQILTALIFFYLAIGIAFSFYMFQLAAGVRDE